MASTYAVAFVVATVLLALAAADGKAGVKGIQPVGKPVAARPVVVVVGNRPAAPRQPQYDYWRPWYTYDSPQQHHRGHARKDSHGSPPKQQRPRRHASPQNTFRSPSNSGGSQWGRGDDKVKGNYVKEVKPVAYDTIIEEEKKVVVKEEPKVVVKEVPTVIVKEVPKKKKAKVNECGGHHHDHSKLFKKIQKDLKKLNKELHKNSKKQNKHHQSHGNAIIFLRTHPPYHYYYTRAPRYHVDDYNGY